MHRSCFLACLAVLASSTAANAQTQPFAATGTITAETGVEIERARAMRTDSTVMLALDLKRTGNAAYLGHLDVELRCAHGTVLDRWSEDIAVYRKLRRMVALKIPEGKRDETAEVRFRIATERDNMDSEVLIRGATREGRVALVQ